ncbi:MAG: hypothetical protein NVSMB31_07140 [Vulcanimicrobiaceae bacterium]
MRFALACLFCFVALSSGAIGQITRAPGRAPEPLATATPGAYLAPPTNAHGAASAAECSDHMPAIFCAPALTTGKFVLLWDYTSCIFPLEGYTSCIGPEGYKIYRVDGAASTLVATVRDAHQRGYVVDNAATCYIVRAFNGMVLSNGSRVCASGSGGPLSLLLHPIKKALIFQHIGYRRDCPGGRGGLGPETSESPDYSGASFYFGTYEFMLPDTSNCGFTDTFRTALWFDTLPFAGRYVTSAKLSYRHVGWKNCLGEVVRPAGDVTAHVDGKGALPRDGRVVSTVGTGGAVADVTDVVRAWVSGAPNYGLEIAEQGEFSAAGICLQQIGDFVLQVEYV